MTAGGWLPLVDVLASVPPERCDYCAPGLLCVLHLDQTAAASASAEPQPEGEPCPS